MLYTPSNVDETQLGKIKALEASTGVTLLAFSQMDLQPAQLKPDVVKEVMELEKELGVTLIAVDH